ncbi:MAG: DUF5615 family PIN-like protein [Salinibacter sp.]
MPRLLADVNISPLTVESLQDAGRDIIRVPGEPPPTASDEQILAFARRQERSAVTQDLDFSDLLALGGHGSPSLITIRVTDPAPQLVASRLLSVLPRIRNDLQTGAAVAVNDERLRSDLYPSRDRALKGE